MNSIRISTQKTSVCFAGGLCGTLIFYTFGSFQVMHFCAMTAGNRKTIPNRLTY